MFSVSLLFFCLEYDLNIPPQTPKKTTLLTCTLLGIKWDCNGMLWRNNLFKSKSISEFEASRASFVCILGPRIEGLISSGSWGLVAASAEAITNIFNRSDYCNYFPSLESTTIVDNLSILLESYEDPMTQTNISIVLAKLAEFGRADCAETVDKVLQSIPLTNWLIFLLWMLRNGMRACLQY
jgi:hypothetical protein